MLLERERERERERENNGIEILAYRFLLEEMYWIDLSE